MSQGSLYLNELRNICRISNEAPLVDLCSYTFKPECGVYVLDGALHSLRWVLNSVEQCLQRGTLFLLHLVRVQLIFAINTPRKLSDTLGRPLAAAQTDSTLEHTAGMCLALSPGGRWY